MMISSELYKENLKGKSQKEIFNEIKKLKQEIKDLIDAEEDPTKEPYLMKPDRKTRIQYDREYLAAAIESYEEAGGVYHPSEKEIRAKAFQDSLEHLGCVKLCTHGFFGSELILCIRDGDDFLVRNLRYYCFADTYTDATETSEFRISRNAFITALKDLHVTDWKRHYVYGDEMVILDGEDWTLEFFFYGPEKTSKYTGSSLYPYNFDELEDLLRMNEEKDDA